MYALDLIFEQFQSIVVFFNTNNMLSLGTLTTTIDLLLSILFGEYILLMVELMLRIFINFINIILFFKAIGCIYKLFIFHQ